MPTPMTVRVMDPAFQTSRATAAAGRRGGCCTTDRADRACSRPDRNPAWRGAMGLLAFQASHRQPTPANRRHQPSPNPLVVPYFSPERQCSGNRLTASASLELRHARRLLGQGQHDDAYNVHSRPSTATAPSPGPARQPCVRQVGWEANFFSPTRHPPDADQRRSYAAPVRHRLACTKAQLQPIGSRHWTVVTGLRSGWRIHTIPT